METKLATTTETKKLKIKQPIKKEFYEEVEIDLPYYFKQYLTETLVKVEAKDRVIYVDYRDNNVSISVLNFEYSGLAENITKGTKISKYEFKEAYELALTYLKNQSL